MLSTPIHNEINYPKDFITKGLFVVKCYNYLDSDADFEFKPMTNILEVDLGLSLTTENTDFLSPLVEDDIFSFVDNNLNDTSISHSQNYYDQMLPSFCEAANIVNSDEDVQNFHKTIASFASELKKKYNIQSQNSNYTYVSSNVLCETARSHNSYNGNKRRKKNKFFFINIINIRIIFFLFLRFNLVESSYINHLLSAYTSNFYMLFTERTHFTKKNLFLYGFKIPSLENIICSLLKGLVLQKKHIFTWFRAAYPGMYYILFTERTRFTN